MYKFYLHYCLQIYDSSAGYTRLYIRVYFHSGKRKEKKNSLTEK